MKTIHLALPEGLPEILGASDQPIEQTAIEMIVLELYRRRTISSGRAAELLGVDQFSFVRRASSLGIPYFDLTEEELAEELRVLRSL